jgi:hypothetical protein
VERIFAATICISFTKKLFWFNRNKKIKELANGDKVVHRGITIMKKICRAVAIFFSITFSFSPQVDASSYYSSATFSTYLRGATRSFSGSNISRSPTGASCSGCVPTTYNISLLRNVSFGSDNRIGTVQCPRATNCLRAWTNVGSGDYYFVFERAADGGVQTISTVYMYNS